MEITDYNNNVVSFEKFKRDLLACLGERVFASTDIELSNHILHCLGYGYIPNPVNNQEVLTRQIESFKKNFKNQFSFWDEAMATSKHPSAFELVMNNALDFDILPFVALARLESKAKTDLLERQNTLAFYREHKFIQEHEKNCKKPEDHEERTQLAFFTRNLDEQRKVLDYFLKRMRDRAISRSKELFSFCHLTDAFYDWPYVSAFPNTEKYFDHRKIDVISHRLYYLDLEKARELRPIYFQNKTSFYAELKKIYPPSEVFRLIRYYIQLLEPFLNSRKKIFDELIELFILEKYFGFYSLALSQIEGIFSEILVKINPNYKKSSLPEKVSVLRPLYEKPEMNLDYYEFHIPKQRNKFMHSGIDEDIALRAHDLLYDLPQLLSVYAGLEIPLVKLTQIIKRRNNDYYINEEGFVEYFQLLDDAKSNPGFKDLKEDIEKFEKDFLSELDVSFLADELAINIPAATKVLFDTIKDHTQINNASETNLDFWTEHAISTKTHKLLTELSDINQTHFDLFMKVERYRYFLDRCQVYIPNMPEEARNKMKDLFQKHKSNLNKVKLMLDAFKKKEDSSSNK